MEPVKFTLCTVCEACPQVEISDACVTIGEDANTARLSHAEWNELVRLIKNGQLDEVQQEAAAARLGNRPRLVP